MPQLYAGSCQCGNVRFEATLDLGTVVACNCSRCGRVGSLLAFAPADDFKLLSGDDVLTEYKFNKNVISHQFCSVCGVQSFSRGKRPGDGADVVAINVRCLDAVDVDALNVKKFDGKNLV
jgi:hypothetical protein